MKREIDITMLMDSYTDNEFNIGGEAGVEADKVVGAVLPQVKQRKKVKPLFKVIAAAAAAVVLAGTVTAATIAIRARYETLTGLDVEYWMEGERGGYTIKQNADGRELPVKLDENNRLLFAADGQDIDITDLVDEDTPYVYEYTGTNGSICYVVVGGAAGDYGYFDLVSLKMSEEETWWNVIGHNATVSGGYEDRRSMFKPWCLAALDELGIWDDINCITDTYFDPAEENGGFGEVFNAEYNTIEIRN